MSETADIARTYESGPSDPIRFSDGPGTYVEASIDAPASRVWELVTDIGLPVGHSEELLAAEWNPNPDGSEGPRLGATFTGTNRHPAAGEWQTQNHVTAFEVERAFAWSVVSVDDPGARWRWDLSADDGATTTLRFSVVLGPGPSGTTMAIDAMPDKEPQILWRRIGEINANMARTIEHLKALAEDDDPS